MFVLTFLSGEDEKDFKYFLGPKYDCWVVSFPTGLQGFQSPDDSSSLRIPGLCCSLTLQMARSVPNSKRGKKCHYEIRSIAWELKAAKLNLGIKHTSLSGN